VSGYWLVLAVVAVGAAAFWAVPSPAQTVRQVVGSGSPTQAPDRFHRRAVRRLRPRADALPLPRRVLLAVPAGLGVSLAVASLTRAGVLLSAVLAVAAVAGVAVTLGYLESAASRRSTEQLVRDLPEAWELLSACLGAGLPLRVALAEVVVVLDGALKLRLTNVLTRVRLGEPEADAWRSIATDPLLGRPARDIARSSESGISLVDLLNAYAQQARSERTAAAEARAKGIGVAAVLPLMMCFLPAFFLIGVVPIVAGALVPLISGW